MKLCRENLARIQAGRNLKLPDPGVFSLPEKVLQFGTGVFIRGLIDYIIDKANNQGDFNGRAVVVKSTATGDTGTFNRQDNLYTLVMKSVEAGIHTEERVVCAAVSRTLNAADDWNEVLACAANKELTIVISNTTEAGIVLVDNDPVSADPPYSYPAKLLSFLKARFEAFNGSHESGLVIIPTELIPDNATLLKDILNKLAVQNRLGQDFIAWMNGCNDFCNSLVDRIVPGRITGTEQQQIQQQSGYEDDLMIMSETFGLWAIETVNQRSREQLSFSRAFANVHIVGNIDKFRELKLRLLNGSHNLSCAAGCIAGFGTVKEAMADARFDAFMQKLINREIAHAIVCDDISLEEAQQFGSSVLERYRNPYIEFEWLSICVQDTAKIRIRAVPIAIQHAEKYGFVPDGICLGFAAYILFMKSKPEPDGTFSGLINGGKYPINDDYAEWMHQKWSTFNGPELVTAVLKDDVLWGSNLDSLKGFSERVHYFLHHLAEKGFFAAVRLLRDEPY